jgi:hypothetical protein
LAEAEADVHRALESGEQPINLDTSCEDGLQCFSGIADSHSIHFVGKILVFMNIHGLLHWGVLSGHTGRGRQRGSVHLKNYDVLYAQADLHSLFSWASVKRKDETRKLQNENGKSLLLDSSQGCGGPCAQVFVHDPLPPCLQITESMTKKLKDFEVSSPTCGSNSVKHPGSLMDLDDEVCRRCDAGSFGTRGSVPFAFKQPIRSVRDDTPRS